MEAAFIRLVFAAALFSVVALHPAAAADIAAPQAVLKSTILVDGDKVTLGDLFDASAFAGAPEAAHVVVLAAPKPGESFMLDAIALKGFAARNKIDWPNTQALNSVKIARAGVLVEQDIIDKALHDALEAQGVTGRTGIRLSTSAPELHVASGSQASIAIEKLAFDKTTGQFTAQLRAPAEDPSGDTARVSGRVYAITELAVPTRDVKPGDTINVQDIQYIEMPTEKLGQNILTGSDDLAGKAARRMLRAGEPVRLGDVALPLLVKKDGIITMVMRTPGMSLTAEGRALDNGAAGDTVKVMNTNSKRVVIGTVEADGTVSVGRGAPSPLAANFPPQSN